jgi:succinoglycan biosynthesis transport protein ExoP
LLVEKRELSNVAFQSVSNAQTTLSALEAQAAELRESIAVARAQLGDRQNDLGSSGDDDGSLSNKIDQIDQRIAWLEEKRGRYNELSQRVKMDEDNFQYYQQRGEEARVNMLLNAENITRVSIVDQAVVPNKPSGPSKKLILIAFLMAGMLLGLCAALGFELLDDRLTTPDALAAASGLPVLAAFGKVRG